MLLNVPVDFVSLHTSLMYYYVSHFLFSLSENPYLKPNTDPLVRIMTLALKLSSNSLTVHYIVKLVLNCKVTEPSREKTNNLGFRTGPAQRLCIIKLEA